MIERRLTNIRVQRINILLSLKRKKERLVNKTSFRGCSKKKRGEHMGRKYRMGEGNTWISWCAMYRAHVLRPLNALHRSRTWAHGPRRRRAPPSRTRTSSTPSRPLLLTACVITGDGNGRVNGPRHLTPCNELGPAEGRAPFRPFSSRSSSCSQLR